MYNSQLTAVADATDVLPSCHQPIVSTFSEGLPADLRSVL